MTHIDHFSILLVEDEYYLRQALKHNIEATGEPFIVTHEATNGAEALDILKKEQVHVVITDIQMPVMDGLALAKQIHLLYPEILTVIITGYSEFEYAREALRQQVFDYITKPVSEDDMLNILAKLHQKLSSLYELPDEYSIPGCDAKAYSDRVITYIQEHYMEDIDFGSFAETMGFSSAYLTKIFKKHTGTTPIKMLTEVRIHKAKQLLTTTSMSIQEIGSAVGYPDQFHFSKTFRKIVSVNPTSYRNTHQTETT
ncbi:MAG: response regulator [bacterium]|nr:response regulator [bacterium]MDY4098451.1 response regulator [Lachnospiraceae bacterium]